MKPVQASPSRHEDMPAPSAEMVFMRVAFEAYLLTAHEKPRRRARAFLDAVSNIMATEESLALLLPIRPASQHADVARARREAMAMFRQFLPTFLARLPRDMD